MKEIIELMRSLPFLLQFFLPGYAFVSVYAFTRFREPSKELNHLFFKTTAFSVLLLGLVALIPWAPLRRFTAAMQQTSPGWQAYVAVAVLMLIGAVLGYVLGLAFSSEAFKKLMRFLHIHRTPNSNVWHDIFRKSGQWVTVHDKTNGMVYTGQLELYDETNTAQPILLLRRYTITKDETVLADHDQDRHAALVVNPQNADRMEIVYIDTPK